MPYARNFVYLHSSFFIHSLVYPHIYPDQSPLMLHNQFAISFSFPPASSPPRRLSKAIHLFPSSSSSSRNNLKREGGGGHTENRSHDSQTRIRLDLIRSSHTQFREGRKACRRQFCAGAFSGHDYYCCCWML